MQMRYWVVALLLAVASPLLAQAVDPPDEDVLKLVDALRSADRLTQEYVEKLAVCRLRRSADASTEYFDVLKGACERRPAVSAELRLPTASATVREGLVILELRDPPCINLEAAVRRYGEGEPVFPWPNAPAEEPMYLRYAAAGLRTSLGFQRRPPFCLSNIVIDRTGR